MFKQKMKSCGSLYTNIEPSPWRN